MTLETSITTELCSGHPEVELPTSILQELYFVIGTNKIEENLDKAIWRARNIAGPMNCRRFGLKTPCATGEVKCHDCHAPHRLCNGMLVHLHRVGGEAEVILINEELGF